MRGARLLVALLLLAVTAGCGLLDDADPEDAAAAFLAAWSAGDDGGAAALTDDPRAAAELLGAARGALAPAGLVAQVGQVRSGTDQATASVNVTWDLGEGRTWSYLGELELREAPDADLGWEVRWAPTVVHPQLGAGQRLEVRTEAAPLAPVVDRTGEPLLSPTPVVTVLLDRLAAGDLPAVAGALAAALSPLDRTITAQGVVDGAARTPDGGAYPVAVLRETDYQVVKPAIHDLPGVRFTRSERLLAPDADFARQVLPGVRAELADRLDGVPGWAVLAVDSSGGVVRTLAGQDPQPGSAVAVGMDRALQTAAEDAVEPVAQQAMLVAVAPSTGELVAVAQNGPADAEGPVALLGRYPPGSTFKIATAAAAVREDGLTAASSVACPATTLVDGRLVPNADRLDLGTVALRTAFARSCNTTFAQLGAALEPGSLPAAALALGLGADFAVPGLTTVTGSVPTAADPVQRAENAFGQGEVLASPFGMALVATTVAAGAPVVPQLVLDRPTRVLRPAPAPDPAAVAELRSMMRAVVTDGTAARLAGAGDVHGKTGTAEFGASGAAHGWFVGYRGDVAFAVLVVDGGSSEPALAIAERFLAATG